jgi:hypothetical protein
LGWFGRWGSVSESGWVQGESGIEDSVGVASLRTDLGLRRGEIVVSSLFRSEPDPAKWVPTIRPDFFGPAPMKLDEWIDYVLQGWWPQYANPQASPTIEADMVTRTLRVMGSPQWPGDCLWIDKWVYLPMVTQAPMAAIIEACPMGGLDFEAEELLTVENAIEKPIPEPIDFGFGPGFKALVYSNVQLADESLPWARLVYVWKVRRGERLWGFRIWMSGEPAHMGVVADDFEEFVKLTGNPVWVR